MKINKYDSVMSAYARNSSGSVRKKQNEKSAHNTDKAEFSSAARTGTAGEKAAIARTAESFASPERIAALKAMIADGSYNISAESVAASILGE